MLWSPRIRGVSRGQARRLVGGMWPPVTPGFFLIGGAGGGELPATLWVDPNGSDHSDIYTIAQIRAAGGSKQWETIGRAAWGSTVRSSPNAAEAAVAGDVVSIAGATYTTTLNIGNRLDPVWSPVNEGTALNPIRFQAAGVVTMVGVDANAPAIGSNGKDYIEWYANRAAGRYWSINFHDVDSGSTGAGTWNIAGDTGPIVFVGCTGGLIEGSLVDGGAELNLAAGQDNYPGIRLESCDLVRVRNNEGRSIYNTGRSSNSVFIQIYGSTNYLVEYNKGYDTVTGISFKDTAFTLDHQGGIVRFNDLNDLEGGGFLTSLTEPGISCDIYRNVVRNAQTMFVLARADFAHGFRYFNNSGYNLSYGMVTGPAGTGAKFWNQIISGVIHHLFNDGAAGPAASNIDVEHCVFHNNSGAFYNHTDGTKSMAQWTTDYPGQNGESPLCTQGDPLFVNAAAGNLRLNGGSSAIDLGRHPDTNDTINAGAYEDGTEIIGLESAPL